MASSHNVDLDEVYAFAVQLGKDAGAMLMSAAQARFGGSNGGGSNQFEEKESAVDIVTKTDEASFLEQSPSVPSADFAPSFHEDVESFIQSSISQRFPSHKFVGEESYSKGASKQYLITNEPTWCVDPLDGTVNYTHLFPMFCVSIALVVDNEPVIGVIHAPFLHQLFSACKGRGAWLSDTHAAGTTMEQQLPLVRNPIPPMPAAAPKGCVFSCEWGKDRRDQPDGNLFRKVDSFLNMAAEIGGREGKGGMVHGVRSLGSATLDLAYVAMGAFDIWWEGGCWEWDVAAGICLLREAGGLVTTANPPPEDLSTAPIPDGHLGSRLYLAIRPAGTGPEETGRRGQERTVREVWRRVRKLDYERPGVEMA